MDAGHGGISRHAVRGSETSGESWRLEGVRDVQVYKVPHWEMRWGAGVTKREVMRR